MLRVKRFAELAGVSIRLLHHYGELGLLKPAHVDDDSGYRYYTLDQLPRLNRILALRDLGLSLEQIALVLESHGLSAEAIRGMLTLKQAELEEHIRDETARLRRVQKRLDYIEHEQEAIDVLIKNTPSIPVISFRANIGLGNTIGPMYAEFWQCLANLELQQYCGRALVIYHNSLLPRPITPPLKERDVEASFILKQQLTANPVSDYRVYELPPYVNVAYVIDQKPDSTRHTTIQQMRQWMSDHGYRLAAPIREIYHRRGDLQTGQGFVTEIQFPLQEDNS
jgi:DNA-binding transcriptional MerR regulator